MVSMAKPALKQKRTKKEKLIYSLILAGSVLVLAVAACFIGVMIFLSGNQNPTPSPQTAQVKPELPEQTGPDSWNEHESKPDKVTTSPAAGLASPAASGRTEPDATEEDPEKPTPEQYRHYIKTQMFMDEAKASLPLLDMRAFNALKAKTGDGEPVSQPNDPSIKGRDSKGLKDGEVWIRINAGYSKNFQEIMAQTADLYRANLEYEGEVTVLLWVGGRPWAKQTYTQAWQ